MPTASLTRRMALTRGSVPGLLSHVRTTLARTRASGQTAAVAASSSEDAVSQMVAAITLTLENAQAGDPTASDELTQAVAAGRELLVSRPNDASAERLRDAVVRAEAYLYPDSAGSSGGIGAGTVVVGGVAAAGLGLGGYFLYKYLKRRQSR